VGYNCKVVGIPAISRKARGKYRKLPKATESNRKLPKASGKYRKLPKESQCVTRVICRITCYISVYQCS